MTQQEALAAARLIVSDLFCKPEELPHGGTFEEVIQRVAAHIAAIVQTRTCFHDSHWERKHPEPSDD